MTPQVSACVICKRASGKQRERERMEERHGERERNREGENEREREEEKWRDGVRLKAISV